MSGLLQKFLYCDKLDCFVHATIGEKTEQINDHRELDDWPFWNHQSHSKRVSVGVIMPSIQNDYILCK